MTVSVPQPVTLHRPASVITSIVLLVFLAVTAAGGGIALITGAAAPPDEWLESIPIVDSWLLPGLVLGIGFGLGSAVGAYGLIYRPTAAFLAWLERPTGHHWSWAWTILIGAGQLAWIALELVYLEEPSVLQLVYGSLAVALMVLPLAAGMRRYTEAG